jgi:BirA family biotin operon repressor/biotin-[acetyl-CoA-carboxylase] ligase
MTHLNQKLVELVQLLNDGEYHDGTSLGEHLCITRAAVWKMIKKLQGYHIEIRSVKGKGYCLESKLFLLDEKAIKNRLRHKKIHLNILEKTTSTNDILKQSIQDNPQMTACFAETQTSGRGRLNRQWHSPFAENIYFSMLYSFQKDISQLSGLSLMVALAMCHAIEIIYPSCSPQVKWPNDIMINGCKVAGILIEIEAQSHGFCQVIIGVGVNVNMHKASKKHINQHWISLSQVMGHTLDRNSLAAEMINTLMDYLQRFSDKGMSDFMEEWKKRDCLYHSAISVQCANTAIKGYCLGIDALGHVLLQKDSGDVLSLASGEASILK